MFWDDIKRELKRKYRKLPYWQRPEIWPLVFNDDRSYQRKWVENTMNHFTDSEQAKLKRRLYENNRFIATYNELCVAALVSKKLHLAYEEHIGQPTPDFTVRNSDGEIIMDSTTGKPMKFFIGVVAYQFLRHHVADKETARATGPVKAITHQPNEGIKFQGGQRMGEMERDSLIASGASGTLFDRFMISSDEYIDVFCYECKNNSSMSSLKSKVCQICGTAGSLVSVAEPRIYKVFMHMMNAVGLEIKETLKPVDEYQNEVFKINKSEAELSAKDIL
jgi:hypothetical protein